jgi:hypothetical protein
MLLAEEGGNKIVTALHELNVQTIVSIPKVGPFDFSITNAVVYMWVSAFIVRQERTRATSDFRRDRPEFRHRPSDRPDRRKG